MVVTISTELRSKVVKCQQKLRQIVRLSQQCQQKLRQIVAEHTNHVSRHADDESRDCGWSEF